MANRIVGLDIGTWAIKAVAIEGGHDVEVVDYREVRLDDSDDEARLQGPDGTVGETEEAAGADGQMYPDPDDSSEPVDKPEGGRAGEREAGTAAGGDEAMDWAHGTVETTDDGGPTEWGDEIDVESLGPWATALAGLIREGFFEGVDRVITSFPDDQAATLHLTVPFERAEEVEEVLPHLLMDELPMSFDDIVYDFIVVPGRQPDQYEALLGFVDRAQMRNFLDTTQAAGLDPAVVGVPELMLRYGGDRAVSAGVDSYGIIDMGHRYTRLLIMSEGKPVVAHTTRRGGRAITEALAENFQISIDEARRLKHDEGIVGPAADTADRRVRKIQGTIEEALRPIVREMRRTFQSAYAKYDVEVDEIYLCGGTSRLDGIGEYLQREFEVSIVDLNLEREVVWRTEPGEDADHPQAALALSGALQQPLDSKQDKLVDLRQDEFVYRGKSSYLRRQLVRLGAVAAVLAVMLAGVLVMQYYDQRAQLQAMERAVAQETEQLFGEAVTEPDEVQSRLEGEAAGDRAFVPQMSAYEQMVRIIEMISEDIPLELDRIEVDTDRSLIQIVGETDTPQSVDDLAGDIEGLECLENVSKEQVDVQGDDEVQFQLQIASACS